MKEPVLQDKYNDHVQFCKYGLELLERVTGAPLSPGSESLDLSKLTNVRFYSFKCLLKFICLFLLFIKNMFDHFLYIKNHIYNFVLPKAKNIMHP